MRRVLTGVIAAGVLVALTACGGIEPEDGDATLHVALAGASGCGYANVHVTVDSVQVHESPLATENSLGWRALEPAAPSRIDLMALDNGELVDLGSTSLPAARYRKLRLVLAPNTAQHPLRNSVTTAGQGETALEMPAAQQSGLVLSIDRDLSADETLRLALDFDACASVVAHGPGGGFLLKPVLRILPWPEGEGSSVAGRLANALADGTRVSLQQAGRIVRSTAPDAEGRFLLSPVPVGTHDLVIVARDRASTVLAEVPVAAETRTRIVADDQPVDLVPSAMRTVSGRIGLAGIGAIPQAQASALQTVGTRLVEVESRPVDAFDGGYALRLPVAPPMFAKYDASASRPTLAPDMGQAGRYGIEASVPGRPAQTREADIRTSDAVVNFEFLP